MRKTISIVFFSVIATFPAFAQSQSNNQENLTYVQNAQKMIDQSNIQAKKQFEKTYPKPIAPVIKNSPANQGKAIISPPPVKPNNPALKPAATQNNENTFSYTPPTPPPVDKNKQSTAPQNIFLPPGSTTSNNTGSSAPNPYR